MVKERLVEQSDNCDLATHVVRIKTEFHADVLKHQFNAVIKYIPYFSSQQTPTSPLKHSRRLGNFLGGQIRVLTFRCRTKHCCLEDAAWLYKSTICMLAKLLLTFYKVLSSEALL